MMISQADIIRTLVNKNCTDESIMSTALSPDCTPPKLLEKFTEAERFDLALDVSMKLGLDVLPLWKTWAMRCLRNRNFQGARDKFRHCFLRLKLPGTGRGTSSAISGLLNDIIDVLTRMEEVKLSLAEEIELIKQRKFSTAIHNAHDVRTDAGQSDTSCNISLKPNMFAECLYYINEYGGVEDHIKFHIRHSLWDQAIKVLLDTKNQINADKFFITEVVLYLISTGRLDNLVSAFIKVDPDINLSFKYFKAIYHFCTIHKRFNLLYYIQMTISDHVAAAKNQIVHFFLKKPTQSYKELNHRLSSLTNAKKNYQDYLNKLEQEEEDKSLPKTDNKNKLQVNNSLFSRISLDEVKKQMKTIDLQIDITRNFAINEVSGCINGIEIVVNDIKDKAGGEPDDVPVTLFESSERRKTFLAALVLIYFDLSCSTYFSKSGLDLANELISSYGLDKLNVFKTAMRIIIEDESCDILQNASLLLERLKEDYLANAKTDTLVGQKSPQTCSSSSSYGTLSQMALNQKTMVKNNNNKINLSKNIAGSSNYTQSPTQPTSLLTVNSPAEAARIICDEVIRDSIKSCREPDYKMELAKLLSGEAEIELYIELGKLSNAQRLAFSMNRPDYVSVIIEEAARLNQNHVKTVCQHWLAKRT